MDGLFHGKPFEQMDDLGGFPIIFGLTPIFESDENLISDKARHQSFYCSGTGGQVTHWA